MKQLIRIETTTTTTWYKTDIKISDEQADQVSTLYSGDIDAFIDNTVSIDEDLCYSNGEIVREKDCGTVLEFQIEDDV